MSDNALLDSTCNLDEINPDTNYNGGKGGTTFEWGKRTKTMEVHALGRCDFSAEIPAADTIDAATLWLYNLVSTYSVGCPPSNYLFSVRRCLRNDWDKLRVTYNAHLYESYSDDYAITYTATSVTDTRRSWVTNEFVGAIVTSLTSTLTVTSNNGTTLYGTGGWSPGTPTDGTGYSVKLAWATPGALGSGTDYTTTDQVQQVGFDTTGAWWSWDIKALVVDAQANRAQVLNLALHAPTGDLPGSSDYSYMNIASYVHATYPPYVEITHTSPGGVTKTQVIWI